MYFGRPSSQSQALWSLRRRDWITLLIALVLAGAFYGAGYYLSPERPNASVQPPRQGWWEWWDQGQYHRSVLALEEDNYNPTEHHYPIGYPLIGMLFYPIMPEHPFLIPDLLFYLVVSFVFVKLCRTMVSPEEALLLVFLGIIWPATVRNNFIRPWTNSPVHAALMVLAYITLIARKERVAGVITGVCAAVIFMTRPGDIAYSWPVMAGLWLGCRDLREAWQRATWFLVGALPLVVLDLYFSFAIHGKLISAAYLGGSAYIGLGLSSLGVKLYTFLIDGFPIFGEPRTLVTMFPILLLILPGIVLFIREFKWKAVLIVGTQAGAVLYFLAYNDFWISNAFKYQGIRYWLWLIPFLCLYSYLSLRFAWQRLGWRLAVALLVVPAFIWILPRMAIRRVNWELARSSGYSDSGASATSDSSQDPMGFSWRCKPDPSDGSCTMSVEFARPAEFDIVELRGIQASKLLYSKIWLDNQISPTFRDHFASDAPDGQTYVVFYGRKRARSIRLTIPPQAADSQTSISALQLALRHTGLALQNPFARFHPRLR